MRSFRLLALVFVVSLLVAAPSFASTTTPESIIDTDTITAGPSKVCHPKKPVTCRAVDLLATEPASTETDSSSVVVPLSFEGGKFLEEVTGSYATWERICMPPKWACRTNSLN